MVKSRRGSAETDPMAHASSAAPARTPAPARVEPREASGLTSRLVLAYVEREGGRDAVDEVLRISRASVS